MGRREELSELAGEVARSQVQAEMLDVELVAMYLKHAVDELVRTVKELDAVEDGEGAEGT